jgi:ElaB/YqjD/DUF883 family membrane-anchored ribosome-binding protein
MTQRKKAQTSIEGGEADDATRADPSGKDPADIAAMEAEIDQTRNAISGDLRTLGERLSPDHLKEDAKEVIGEAKNRAVETLQEAKNVATSTFQEVKDNAMDTVNAKVDDVRRNVRRAERETVDLLRQNAVPLALIGVGITWFLSNRRSRNGRWDGEYGPAGHGRWRYPPDPRESRSRVFDDVREGASRAAGGAQEFTEQARERAGRWVEGAEHSVSDVAGRARGFAEREYYQARDVAHQAGQRIGDAAHEARDLAAREWREARAVSLRTLEDHPLAVGAAAVAAGVGIGLLLPTTARENEWIGSKREELAGEAREAVQDWTHTAKETARNVKQSLTGNAG